MSDDRPTPDYRSWEDDASTDADGAADERLRRYYREPPSGDGLLFLLACPVAFVIILCAIVAFLVWA